MRSVTHSMLPLLGRAAVTAALFALVTAAQPLRSAGPCDTITSPPAPHPPGGQPEPYIGGHVVLGQTTVVSGAIVRLHRCDGPIDVVVASQLSASNGSFFFDALAAPYWYYVVADLSGPLVGRSAVATPSLIPIGSATSAVELRHE